jgi:fluoroacetyl-CoA thioesterase
VVMGDVRVTLSIGVRASITKQVTQADTARALGSGSLPVLATPRLLAWAEQATCAAIDPNLEPGTTSVGSQVELQHLAPSPVGEQVTVIAMVQHVDGRQAWFDVTATHGNEQIIATGRITRIVVNAQRFLEQLRHS